MPRSNKPDPFVAPAWQGKVPSWVLAAAFGLSLYLSGLASRLFSAPFDSYVGFWLPSGFYIAGLLLAETRRWPWMVAVALPCTLAIDYGHVGTLWPSLGYFAANTAEALAGAWLVRRLVAATPSFKSLREFFYFISLGAGLPPALAATVGVAVEQWSGTTRSLRAIWLTWWASESIAIVLVAPALLIVLTDDRPRILPSFSRKKGAEAAALFLATVAMVWLISGQHLGPGSIFKYAIIPIMLWTGIRFGVRGAVCVNLLVGLFLGYYAAHDPYNSLPESGRLLSNFYSFLFITSLVSLVPAMVLRDRDSLIAQLAREIRKNETLLQTALDGNHILDLDGNLVQFNEAFRRTLGYSREELSRMNVTQWDAQWTSEQIKAGLRENAEKGNLFETKHRCRDGTLIDVEIIVAGIDIDGRRCLYCSGRNITARKALEQQLLQAQKLEAIGKLAGGVAHDFNNILTGMILNLEANELDEGISEQVKVSLRENKAMAQRAARITEQLLLFARKQTMHVEAIELNATVANGLKLIERTIGEHISVTFSSGQPELWIRGDARMLDQVVMNLSINARDAMPGGGRLAFETGLVEIREDGAEARGGAKPGAYASLRISDTGTGIATDVLPHVFEPFYTTKDVGKGTGLGLASVDGIVKQHGGWVTVGSTEGKGTSFCIFLPLSERSPVPPQAPAKGPVKGSRERILLVEDEEAVRKITAVLLERLGYEVLVASNGPEALALRRSQGRPFDLLLADVVMPGGMSGLQLAEQMHAAEPSLKVVVMSGYAEQIMRDQELRERGFSFIAKPFESTKLAATIKASLLSS